MSTIRRVFESLRRLWSEMDPSRYPPPEPIVRRLDGDQVEFLWQGQPFLLDTRAQTILRDGRLLAKFSDVRSIGIIEHRGENQPTWTVVIQLERSSNIRVGVTAVEVYASIAAAKLSSATGGNVRVL